ncbi:unnamed protein product [Fraxinus pennsylvanica]|uniref:Protein kinase domain-containing protein n=1 Tax=Fraxinus pennsylvanica TaxID=56036 RepID=A0AAD2EAH9_9LAMI|nr:unnamed protein product [Fraxinus pennsylvanica]
MAGQMEGLRCIWCGFGVVYKGKLPSGQEIAVKRLSMNSGQERSERLLVYEFVENGSLDRFIFDPIKRQYLDWDTRYKIIGGVAKGDETQGNTSRIVGTYGYMAPEYAMHGHFSGKSDVFSFGVLVLEIISGQKTSSFQYGENVEDLLSCAWKNWHEGTSGHIIDPSLRTSARSLRDIMRCIHIGLLCVQEDAADRPTMATIVLMLTSFSITLPIPSRPAFFVSSRFGPEISLLQEQNSRATDATESSKNRSGNSTDASINDVSMSDLYPR